MGTQRYRVRQGYSFGKNREYGSGDIVELTAHEAAPILHVILEPVPVEPEPDPFSGLNAKIVGALQTNGITADDLLDLSDEEIMELDGIGAAALKAIREQFPHADES